MTRRAILVVAAVAPLSLAASPAGRGGLPANWPALVLWAWERPERLTFVDPATTAVAYLAGTVTLTADAVEVRPRMQPLRLAPGTRLAAVVRIEARGFEAGRGPALLAETVSAVARLLSRPAVSVAQVDFDATRSQRPFYRSLLQELRRSLSPDLPLSITALASWCLDDAWLDGLPIDEAVPMLFRMGEEAPAIRARLASGEDFASPLCRRSFGLSMDEPTVATRGRRRYVFSPEPWSAGAVTRAAEVR